MKKLSGKIIVMEGAIDGIGKSTQFELLKEFLLNNGYEVYTHHFPSYNTVHGNLSTEYLSGNLGNPNELSPYYINAIYAIDRAVVYQKEIKNAIKEGKVILLDRYTTSSLIYQPPFFDEEEKREECMKFIYDYEFNKLGIKKPAKVIFLYTSFELAQKLRKERKNNEGIKDDVYESSEEYLKKIYDFSLKVADNYNFDYIQCEKDNKMRSKEEIHNDIKKLIFK